MKAIEQARQVAKERRARVVFPETDDPRVAAAMARLTTEGLAEPVGVVEKSQAQLDVLIAQRGLKPGIAARMLDRPLIRAAAMLATGEADVMVAGAGIPTKKVIEAAGLAVGLASEVEVPSSFFLLELPDGRALVLADCAVNVAPNSTELSAIARASAQSAQLLLGRADVALLSYATGQSGSGPSVDLVREVARSTGFPGPIQVDAALNPIIAARKGASGAGQANTLIFPNLDAGNIAYKLLCELAGAKAYGPFLQGYRKPICDLSRSASEEEIFTSTLLAIAQS